MVAKLKEKPRCPESIEKDYYYPVQCKLNGKSCVLASGNNCPYYEDYFKEIEERWIDFRRAYQELQNNTAKLRANLRWLYIGMVITIGILAISLILLVN